MAGFLSCHPILVVHVSLIYYHSMLWFDTWERVRVGRENPGDWMRWTRHGWSGVLFNLGWLVGIFCCRIYQHGSYNQDMMSWRGWVDNVSTL